MNRLLCNINWNALLPNRDVNDAAVVFSNIMLYSIDQYVPKKIVKGPKHPAWSNSKLRKLKSKKRRALRDYTRHRTLLKNDDTLRLTTTISV